MKLVSTILGGVGLGTMVTLFTLGGCGGDKSAPPGTGGGASVGGGGDVGGGSQGGSGTSVGGSSSGGGTKAAGGGSTSTAKLVPSALMTDFSEVTDGTVVNASAASFNWGKTGLTGGTFIYGQDPAPTNADSPTGTVTGGALTLTASTAIGHYSGFGFYFGPNGGSDACAYSGFSFTIVGDLGGSTVDVQMQMTPDYPLNDNNKGTCDYITADAGKWSYCTNPHVALTALLTTGVPATGSAAATVKVPWGQLVGGKPVSAIDCGQLLGIQLQFNCPATATAACAVNVTIDDLTFYNG